MEAEHPIPQEVSSYQFKLVGDMTIQQFFQVAGGALVSLIIYSSNIEVYVKWPLIVISFLIGVAFAFFPIEDRPLSKWLVLFMKAIYSPTVYVWNKNAVRHVFFQPETDGVVIPVDPLNQVAASSLPTTTPGVVVQATGLDKLEAKEQAFLNKVDVEFSAPKTEVNDDLIKAVIQTAPVSNTNVIKQQASKPEIAVPQNQTVKIPEKPVASQNQSPTQDIFNSTSAVGGQVSPIPTQTLKSSQAAVFSPEAAPPTPPTSPNIIVGQALDTSGKILDGMILEIKDEGGRSVRALRTNRLGHFMIVTPLSNGKYQITSEKEGYQFEPVTITMEGRVIPPIMITGKKVVGSQ